MRGESSGNGTTNKLLFLWLSCMPESFAIDVDGSHDLISYFYLLRCLRKEIQKELIIFMNNYEYIIKNIIIGIEME